MLCLKVVFIVLHLAEDLCVHVFMHFEMTKPLGQTLEQAVAVKPLVEQNHTGSPFWNNEAVGTTPPASRRCQVVVAAVTLSRVKKVCRCDDPPSIQGGLVEGRLDFKLDAQWQF